MTQTSRQPSITRTTLPLRASLPTVPTWVADWLRDAHEQSDTVNVVKRATVRGRSHTLCTATIDVAVDATGDTLTAATRAAYDAIRSQLVDEPHRHVVRFWNVIPRLHDAAPPHADRYHAFNAGRHAALSEWFGSAEDLAAHAPAASGVGGAADRLVVHALAAAMPGDPIENPRQIPAYRYSARYGPRPPCFARATRCRGPSHDVLLLSGTAAITGETTRHADDVDRQFDLTCENLRAILNAGGVTPAIAPIDPLHALAHVRAYVPPETNVDDVAARLQRALAPATTIELVAADLCRADLHIEIEGLATLRPHTEPI